MMFLFKKKKKKRWGMVLKDLGLFSITHAGTNMIMKATCLNK